VAELGEDELGHGEAHGAFGAGVDKTMRPRYSPAVARHEGNLWKRPKTKLEIIECIDGKVCLADELSQQPKA
jgi:hypothetical protein